MGWRIPADRGPGIKRYVVRFFTKDTYASTNGANKERQAISADQTWAKAKNLPSTRPVYGEV